MSSCSCENEGTEMSAESAQTKIFLFIIHSSGGIDRIRFKGYFSTASYWKQYLL